VAGEECGKKSVFVLGSVRIGKGIKEKCKTHPCVKQRRKGGAPGPQSASSSGSSNGWKYDLPLQRVIPD
jgi:hypothetical protein